MPTYSDFCCFFLQSTKQCHRYLQTSQYLQMSSFSSVMMKGNFSQYYFLKVLKFQRRQCDKCKIRRINHALLPTLKYYLKNGANGASVLMLYMFAAFCFNKKMPTLGRLGETPSASCLSCTSRELPITNLHTTVLGSCALHPSVASARSGTRSSINLWQK